MSGLHYKKDGGLDMRFSSSRAVGSGNFSGSSGIGSPASGPHLRRDGGLDMRYRSSKETVRAATQPAARQSAAVSRGGFDDSNPLGWIFGGDSPPSRSSQQQQQHSSSSWLMDQQREFQAELRELERRQQQERERERQREQERERERERQREQERERERERQREQERERERQREREERERERKRAQEEREREREQARERERELQQKLEQLRLQNTKRRFQQHQESLNFPFPVTVEADLNADKIDMSTVQVPDKIMQLNVSSLKFNGKLGKGGFGTVFKAEWNGRPVAVKQLYMNQLNKKQKLAFQNELSIMSKLNSHPNLVQLLACCLQPPCIVMELVEQGNLYRLLHVEELPAVTQRMNRGVTRQKFAVNIADGMMQLHASGIVHCDLKPNNVLISNDWVAKVCDFGLAKLRVQASMTTDSRKQSTAGTPAYMAPELLQSMKPNFSTDVYSFAILLNELASCELPFDDETHRMRGLGPFGVVERAKQGLRPRLCQEGASEFVTKLVSSCWHEDCQKRPNFDTICKKVRNHEFTIHNLVEE